MPGLEQEAEELLQELEDGRRGFEVGPESLKSIPLRRFMVYRDSISLECCWSSVNASNLQVPDSARKAAVLL